MQLTMNNGQRPIKKTVIANFCMQKGGNLMRLLRERSQTIRYQDAPKHPRYIPNVGLCP